MNDSVLVNGRAIDRIEVGDRGLQYGDGLFETLAVRDGRPCHWVRHEQRLRLGCQRLGLDMPDPELLRDEAARLCAGRERAVLKVIVTRGAGGRGYRPPVPASPTRILTLHPFPEYPRTYYTDGVTVRWCTTRLGSNPQLAGIKHLNRLEQVLARAEWDDGQCAEGLMLDRQGRVVCGTMSNVFWVHDGILATPPLDECGVAGVTRARILEAAERLGVQAALEALAPETLLEADEVFLCNSVIGIWPVSRIDARSWARGPLTARIMANLDPD